MVDPPSKPLTQFTPLNIENSLTKPHDKVWPRPPKGSTKHLNNFFLFSKIQILSRGLPWRRLLEEKNCCFMALQTLYQKSDNTLQQSV